MNVKRTFGTILTVLGIAGLLYTGYQLMQKSEAYTNMAVVGVIGLIFFFAGIGLDHKTSDKS